MAASSQHAQVEHDVPALCALVRDSAGPGERTAAATSVGAALAEARIGSLV